MSALPPALLITGTCTVFTLALLYYVVASLHPPLPSTTTTASRTELTCAPDYHSCGSVPAPGSAQVPCCNASSYCYRRGAYFSQCRPRTEIAQYEATNAAKVVFVPPCAPRFVAQCSALIPCCHPHDSCTPITRTSAVCFPNQVYQRR